MDGFLNIDKPVGWTSHDVVAKARKIVGEKRIGHAGTLDPFATGVLPLCVGRATRLVSYLLDSDKGYRVVMRLGETTDTQDATGRVLSQRDGSGITGSAIEAVLADFRGAIRQIPPMYSAVKVGGERLYRAAREGREVERPPREVTIRRLDMIGMEGGDVRLEVVASRGTYIRSLCADVGERLGVGAHCRELVRTRSGPFRLDEAVTLEELDRLARERRVGLALYPMEEVLKHFPAVRVNRETVERVSHGAAVTACGVEELPERFRKGETVRIQGRGPAVIAVARALMDRQEVPRSGKDVTLFKVEKVLV